jgi:hypothetical protein
LGAKDVVAKETPMWTTSPVTPTVPVKFAGAGAVSTGVVKKKETPMWTTSPVVPAVPVRLVDTEWCCEDYVV